MTRGYFHRVTAETATRFWINNPTDAEVDQALEAGAINCTTNPTYCARLLDAEPSYIHPVIDQVVAEVDDDDAAAERVYQLAGQRLMRRFLPLYERSGGSQGFVTIQGDPRRDDDPDFIVQEALRHTSLGPNFMAKIPVTEAGAAAIEALVERNVPVCATEIFGVAQAIYISEAYRRAVEKTGNRPPFFVTHITGIFDDYLASYVKREGVTIAPEVLAQAGWAVAHEQYRVLKEGGYPGVMLGGGATGEQHFTEMVGGDMHVTINWSIAEKLLEADGPVVSRIHEPVAREVFDELTAKLPDFRRAFATDGLAPSEFKDFGPLILFRTMFVKGYERLVSEVASRRVGAAAR